MIELLHIFQGSKVWIQNALAFINSDGHRIKLIKAPPNPAEGTIIASCGVVLSDFPCKKERIIK